MNSNWSAMPSFLYDTFTTSCTFSQHMEPSVSIYHCIFSLGILKVFKKHTELQKLCCSMVHHQLKSASWIKMRWCSRIPVRITESWTLRSKHTVQTTAHSPQELRSSHLQNILTTFPWKLANNNAKVGSLYAELFNVLYVCSVCNANISLSSQPYLKNSRYFAFLSEKNSHEMQHDHPTLNPWTILTPQANDSWSYC